MARYRSASAGGGGKKSLDQYANFPAKGPKKAPKPPAAGGTTVGSRTPRPGSARATLPAAAVRKFNQGDHKTRVELRKQYGYVPEGAGGTKNPTPRPMNPPTSVKNRSRSTTKRRRRRSS